MSTNRDQTAKPKGGEEMFYLDENGKKQDASIHEEILAGGKDEPGAFDDLIEQLGLSKKFAATFVDKEKKPIKK